MAGSSVPQLDALSCSICEERLNDPRILPCAHTFCLPCLERMETRTREHGEKFHCPSCRSNVDLSENGVRGLPANFTLSNLMEELQLANRRPSAPSVCEFCKKEDGSLRCIDCRMYMCESCVETHRRVAGSSNDHVLIETDKLSDEKFVSEAVSRKAPKCSDHGSEDVRFYCKTCHKLVCRDCTVVDHNGHQCVEVTNWSFELKQDLKKLSKQSKDKGHHLDRAVKHFNNTTYEALDKFTAVKRQIDTRFKELKQILEIDRQELLRKTEEVEKETCDKMTNVSDSNRQWMEQKGDTLSKVEKLIKDDNQWEIIRMSTALSQQFEEVNRSGDDLSGTVEKTRRDVVRTELSFRATNHPMFGDRLGRPEEPHQRPMPNMIGKLSFRPPDRSPWQMALLHKMEDQ